MSYEKNDLKLYLFQVLPIFKFLKVFVTSDFFLQTSVPSYEIIRCLKIKLLFELLQALYFLNFHFNIYDPLTLPFFKSSPLQCYLDKTASELSTERCE